MPSRINTRLAPVIRHIRNRHLFLLDIILIALSAWLSFAMRLGRPLPANLETLMTYMLVAELLRLAVLYGLGIYTRYWLFASVEELLSLALSTSASSVAIGIAFLAVLLPLEVVRGFPRSVIFIDWLLSLGLIGGSRFLMRAMGDSAARAGRGSMMDRVTTVLIVGAGEAGGIIARELTKFPQLGMKAIGFVDDDAAKQGTRVHGLPVLGGCHDLAWLIVKHQVQQVIIAMPTAPGPVIRHIRQIGGKAGATVRTMPAIHEILSGQISLRQVRDIQIEDLLRREPVQTDIQAIHGYLGGKRVAVTGAGGSIGAELCRQILSAGPSMLLLIGHGENSIFEIEQELLRNFPTVPLQPIIADVRDAERITWLFRSWRPQIVFHAAAHKHVPLMELNVAEAVTNNILGTRHLVRAAEAANVERLVLISTDKAVRPVSVMGASKRIGEMIVQEAARRLARPYVAVRFGNVLGSRGSVIPLFKEQIRAGGPVTITHPDMTRYFMTIPEAVTLVLQAGVLGVGGEIFVLDMGQPIKVLNLALDLIELSGLQPYDDIEIVFTGVRPGEKLHETLLCGDETFARTAHEKILVAANSHEQATANLDQIIDELQRLARGQREGQILDMFRQILPDYRAIQLPPVRMGDSRETGPAPHETAASGTSEGLRYSSHAAG
jgi:FlaA1/EpsC-like NDP-sugar epimerase